MGFKHLIPSALRCVASIHDCPLMLSIIITHLLLIHLRDYDGTIIVGQSSNLIRCFIFAMTAEPQNTSLYSGMLHFTTSSTLVIIVCNIIRVCSELLHLVLCDLFRLIIKYLRFFILR